MIPLGDVAEQQVRDLLFHYAERGRPEAQQGLFDAIDQACGQIERDREAGLPAPRPYPGLARPGELWTKAGPYWIAYVVVPSPVILAVFYDTADIPRRRERDLPSP